MVKMVPNVTPATPRKVARPAQRGNVIKLDWDLLNHNLEVLNGSQSLARRIPRVP